MKGAERKCRQKACKARGIPDRFCMLICLLKACKPRARTHGCTDCGVLIWLSEERRFCQSPFRGHGPAWQLNCHTDSVPINPCTHGGVLIWWTEGRTGFSRGNGPAWLDRCQTDSAGCYCLIQSRQPRAKH